MRGYRWLKGERLFRVRGYRTFMDYKIAQKAKWVHARYPELEEEDLIQEGKTLVVKLRKSQGSDVPIAYLLAAVQYHFSNLMRATAKRHNLYPVSVDDIYSLIDKDEVHPMMTNFHDRRPAPAPLAPDKVQEVNDNVDRENFMKTISNPKLARVLRYLINGEKPRWIAKRQKTSVRQVYRQLTTLRKLRKEWEKDE